jgi:hypothetical protein
MTKLQEIEAAITDLTPEEVAQLKTWLHSYSPEALDRRIEQDAQSGKLNRLAQEALAEHKRGGTKPL